MKAVILCGGLGTRLREETEFKPKPMVTVGGYPILWHIMKTYSHFGINDFVLCLGYKGDVIRQFFLNQEFMTNDITIGLKGQKRMVHETSKIDDWNVTLVDTGANTMTGGRIKRIQKYISEDNFFVTYGDGVSDINISALLAHHKKIQTIGTLSGVNPQSRFGMIKSDQSGIVTEFVEKPVLYDDFVNGGYYVFKKDFFDYLSSDESCVLEKTPLSNLAEKKQLSLYKHRGFWACMDTYRDFMMLNEIWDSGKVPWKIWK